MKKIDKDTLNDIEKTIKTKPEKQELNYIFRTGSTLLDLQVGGGEGLGYPCGRIVNFVGNKSSGKTFEACEIIAWAYHNLGKENIEWVYNDCESGFSFNTKKLYGFSIMPIDKNKRHKTKTVEDAYCDIREFAEKLPENKYGIYVLDSLDGLTSMEADEIADERYKQYKKNESYDKGSYKMGKAKFLSNEFFPQLAGLLEKKKTLLIVISQVRANVNPMSFDEFTRSGGLAMDLYCHTVNWLANVFKEYKENRAIGVRIKANNKKSKTPRPYRTTFVDILFHYGIDNVGSNVNFLFDLLTPKGQLIKNPRCSWGGTKKEENLTVVKEFLIQNNLEEKYREKINSKLKVNEVIEWINTKKILSRKYNDYLLGKDGTNEMSREEMIQYIEKNNLKKELEKRVIEKWELIEKRILPIRSPKYSEEV